MNYDDEFVKYFDGNIRQLFLYVTDRCGLRCEQCLYKTTLANRELKFEDAVSFAEDFYTMGARKLTLIGGEPLLFGGPRRTTASAELVGEAAAMGYQYIRLDTNGQQRLSLLDDDRLRKLSNLAVSIDGHTAEINNPVRGRNTFARAVRFATRAVDLGYHTTITACVHRGNVDRLDEMIEFAVRLGVRELNFHPLFKMGIARDDFSGDTDIEPRLWLEQYHRIRALVEADSYPIHVRLPQRFVPTTEYSAEPARYHYCPTLMGERILVHPNGEMRICALCIGTPLVIGRFSGEDVSFCGWDSEISAERRLRVPCMSQVREFNDLTPLCISYKPRQHEYVWLQDNVDDRLSLR